MSTARKRCRRTGETIQKHDELVRSESCQGDMHHRGGYVLPGWVNSETYWCEECGKVVTMAQGEQVGEFPWMTGAQVEEQIAREDEERRRRWEES